MQTLNKFTFIFLFFSLKGLTIGCSTSDLDSLKTINLIMSSTHIIEAQQIDTLSSTSTKGKFKVTKWLKGNGPNYVIISGFGEPASCKPKIFKGKGILFTVLDSNSRGNIFSLSLNQNFLGNSVIRNYNNIDPSMQINYDSAISTLINKSKPQVPKVNMFLISTTLILIFILLIFSVFIFKRK